MNLLANCEQLLWNTLLNASGCQTARYQRVDLDTNVLLADRIVPVIPETPRPDAFAFEDAVLYKTGRVFKVGQEELGGLKPREGDRLIFEHDGVKTVYTVQRTSGNGPCYEELGSYGIILRVHVSQPRAQEDENE